MAGRPWFGPKKYGLGFSPATWEGWLLTAAYVAFIVIISLTLAGTQPYIFGTAFALATALFLLLVFLKRGAR